MILNIMKFIYFVAKNLRMPKNEYSTWNIRLLQGDIFYIILINIPKYIIMSILIYHTIYCHLPLINVLL